MAREGVLVPRGTFSSRRSGVRVLIGCDLLTYNKMCSIHEGGLKGSFNSGATRMYSILGGG